MEFMYFVKTDVEGMSLDMVLLGRGDVNDN
ncbi:hypothetical protein SAMN05216235_0306 [Salinicoccus halodurans]|uniref:Uncharacterized protein n=1 Tax=Salinicoccus halodurans TaxID=407035 RepID=A0AA94HCA1_9STAP|nr:hypothetical protein SAMN05216235_0306 [Salinicoccus halodurans]